MTQSNWWACRKCAMLAFGSSTKCPADGMAHEHAGHDLRLRLNDPTADGNPNVSTGWQWCRNCQGLSVGDPENQVPGKPLSICATGGLHDHIYSGAYALDTTTTPLPAGRVAVWSHNWQWCTKCYCLFQGSLPGVCTIPSGPMGQPDYSHDPALKDDKSGDLFTFQIAITDLSSVVAR